MARTPTLEGREAEAMAGRFRFETTALDNPLVLPTKKIRQVAPSLKRIDAWISSVGAAVTLADLDRDGLSNDIILVDPRTDAVTVMAAPDSGKGRYAPFALKSEHVDRNTMAPMGSLCGDFDENGQPDVLLYYWGRPPLLFMRRSEAMAEGSFEIVEIGPKDERWYTNAALLTDLDGDGHTDLVLGNYFQDGARILDANAKQPQRMQRSMSRAMNGGRNRFFLGAVREGGPLLREVTAYDEQGYPLASDFLTGWTLATGARDFNQDGLPELFFGNDFGPDRFFANLSSPGILRFQLLKATKGLGVANSKVLGNDSFKGMGVDFPDLNGDGTPDLIVSNIASEWALEESHQAFVSRPGQPGVTGGRSRLDDLSESLGISNDGWGWDVRAEDFDNDGVDEIVRGTGFVRGTTNRWPELHELAMANDTRLEDPNKWPPFGDGIDISGHDKNPFYVRSSSGRYFDLGPRIGLQESQVTRGVATGDTDGDGRMDMVFANQWRPSLFLHNESAPDGFIGLNVVIRLDGGPTVLKPGRQDGSIPSRPAFGTEVRFDMGGGRVATRAVDGGNGHSGKRAPAIHMGLGSSGTTGIPYRAIYRSGGELKSADGVAPQGWSTLYISLQESAR